MTHRLIGSWLPIATLGQESVRERRSMTALLPTYYLHVWWARRPLVASRASVLASRLQADADDEQFMWVLGIHGDPVAAKDALAKLAANFRARLEIRLSEFFPQPNAPDAIDTTYLLTHTITCPHCDSLIPLSPNWRLAPGAGRRWCQAASAHTGAAPLRLRDLQRPQGTVGR